MNRKDVQYLLDNPMTLLQNLSEAEQKDLEWYINLSSRIFFYRGYMLEHSAKAILQFPSYTAFCRNSDYDKSLKTLYNAFAWRGFLKYFRPVIHNNELVGFSYLGNVPLADNVTNAMLKFPTVDWVNATFFESNLKLSEEMRDRLTTQMLEGDKQIQNEYKACLARIFAALYLLDYFPFITSSYNPDLSKQISCVTRNSELLKTLLGEDKAEPFIKELQSDIEFDPVVSERIKVVELKATVDELSNNNLTYTAQMTEIDLSESIFSHHFLPYFQFASFTDGVVERINDMPQKAALLTLELTKGVCERYCTLSSQVLKRVYSDIDIIKTSARARFKCGLDIEDFSFKYWNLQASIHTKRQWSGFSPFSLVSIQDFDITKLRTDVLNTNYDLIITGFIAAIENADTETLKKIAVICDIKPNRPALKNILLKLAEKKHPSELFKIMMTNRATFKI